MKKYITVENIILVVFCLLFPKSTIMPTILKINLSQDVPSN